MKYVYIAVALFIGIQAFRYQKRVKERDSAVLRGDKLESELTTTASQLDAEKRTSRKYERQVGELTVQNSDQAKQILAGQRDAARTDERIEAGKRTVNALANQLRSKDLDIAYYKGLSDNNLSSTEASDTAKRNTIKLAGYVKVYKDSTQALKQENGQQREEIVQLKEKNTGQAKEISDLENELNKTNATTADYIEAVPKGFANIGYGKRIRKATHQIRTGRVRYSRE